MVKPKPPFIQYKIVQIVDGFPSDAKTMLTKAQFNMVWNAISAEIFNAKNSRKAPLKRLAIKLGTIRGKIK